MGWERVRTPHKGREGLRGEKTRVGRLEAQEPGLCLPRSLSHCEQAGNCKESDKTERLRTSQGGGAGFPGGTSGKEPTANAGDIRNVGPIPGSGRPPGKGHGNPHQYFCLENPMDRGAWQFIESQRAGHH